MDYKDKAKYLSEQAKLIEQKAENIDEQFKNHPN